MKSQCAKLNLKQFNHKKGSKREGGREREKEKRKKRAIQQVYGITVQCMLRTYVSYVLSWLAMYTHLCSISSYYYKGT